MGKGSQWANFPRPVNRDRGEEEPTIKTSPWHSIKQSVHHDNTSCNTGNRFRTASGRSTEVGGQIRTASLALLLLVAAVACGDEREPTPASGTSLQDLATLNASITSLKICDVVESIPDFEMRANQILGSESVKLVASDAQTDEDPSSTCMISGVGGERPPHITFALSQEPDVATEVEETDTELHPGCWMSADGLSDSGAGVRCPPDLAVGFTIRGGSEASGTTTSASDLKELLKDFLDALDN